MGRTLVLGLGNLLRGDEGVGVHVVRALEGTALPPHVRLLDGGTAGLDLLPFLRGVDRLIVVDALRAGGEAGTVYRWELEEWRRRPGGPVSLHELGLMELLAAAEALGARPSTLILGIEPQATGWGLSLSPAVAQAVPRVVDRVRWEVSGSGTAKGGGHARPDAQP